MKNVSEIARIMNQPLITMMVRMIGINTENVGMMR
jgi:hypothetical protein